MTQSQGKRNVSDAARAANRANAQKSTGPKTPQGKARAAKNHTKHGFYAVNPVLDWENPDEYRAYRSQLMAALAPEDALEQDVAEQYVIDGWRLVRLIQYELEVFHHQRYQEPLNQELSRVSILEQRLKSARFRALKELRALRRERQNGDDPVAALNPEDIGPALTPAPLWHPSLNNPEGVMHYPPAWGQWADAHPLVAVPIGPPPVQDASEFAGDSARMPEEAPPEDMSAPPPRTGAWRKARPWLKDADPRIQKAVRFRRSAKRPPGSGNGEAERLTELVHQPDPDTDDHRPPPRLDQSDIHPPDAPWRLLLERIRQSWLEDDPEEEAAWEAYCEEEYRLRLAREQLDRALGDTDAHPADEPDDNAPAA